MPASVHPDIWTDERVERLRDLWHKGWSASQIAADLGLTRSAICGKARRLGLAARALRRSDLRGGRPLTLRTLAVRGPSPVHPAAPRRAPRPADPPHVGAVRVLDLRPRDCRWPFGDPRAPDFAFCDKPSEPGLPYCQAHCATAYRAPEGRAAARKAAA